MTTVCEVDFENPKHCEAVISLMNHYMTDEMGGKSPHNKESANRMIQGLKQHCNKYCILAENEGKYIGLANCFIGFGTFAAKTFINIHDVVVLKEYRGKGTGRILLNNIKEKAKTLDCAKVTLEVRDDNIVAQNLYKSLGFKDCEPQMFYWAAYFD